jgi:hypothetical protein
MRYQRRILPPDEREQRKDLICNLYKAGCTTNTIAYYLDVSHGTVVSSLNEEGIPRRRRGRPSFSAPPAPRPDEIMGEDYIPPYFNEAELVRFEYRLTHLMNEAPKRATFGTKVSEPFDLPQSIYRELGSAVQLTLDEDQPTPDPTGAGAGAPETAFEQAQTLSPSQLVTQRLAESGLDPLSGSSLLSDSKVESTVSSDEDGGEEEEELVAY